MSIQPAAPLPSLFEKFMDFQSTIANYCMDQRISENWGWTKAANKSFSTNLACNYLSKLILKVIDTALNAFLFVLKCAAACGYTLAGVVKFVTYGTCFQDATLAKVGSTWLAVGKHAVMTVTLSTAFNNYIPPEKTDDDEDMSDTASADDAKNANKNDRAENDDNDAVSSHNSAQPYNREISTVPENSLVNPQIDGRKSKHQRCRIIFFASAPIPSSSEEEESGGIPSTISNAA